MGFIVLIIIALGIWVFINIKINNFKDRAQQEILKNTGISSSNINEKLTNNLEKK